MQGAAALETLYTNLYKPRLHYLYSPPRSPPRSPRLSTTVKVCFEIFVNPQTLLACGHTMCKTCVETYRSESEESPADCACAREVRVTNVYDYQMCLNLFRTVINHFQQREVRVLGTMYTSIAGVLE